MKPIVPITVAVFASAMGSAQTPAGGEVPVNTYTTGRQIRARAAVALDGDFVIVWESHGQDGSDRGIFGQRFAASGARRGSEFRVNVSTTGAQARPAIGMQQDGAFVVAWDTPRSAGPETIIAGRRFDSAGNPIGAEFIVNSSTTGSHFEPSVGMAPDGRFVVAWTADAIDGSGTGIAARTFDRHGTAVGNDFLVNTFTGSGQISVSAGAGLDGAFVVAWEGSDPGYLSRGIRAQRLDAAGNRLGTELQVNTYTTGNQRWPSVGVSPAGGFVVAWAGFQDGAQYGVFARRYDASGTAVGAEFQVNTYTTGDQLVDAAHAVAHDDAGNFVVTWTGPDASTLGVFGQRFDASGVRRGSEFAVNAYSPGQQGIVTVASDPVGNLVTTWYSEQEGSDVGIYARRFGGLFPAALAVDPAGNGVLEPGESVAVHPAWRNLNGAAQTFSATLAAFSGPPGAVYTVTDGAGDYGTVADGALGPCLDCFGVSVSAPPSRPAVHWDASASEGIIPEAQGQQKRWLLHIGDSFADVPRGSGFYRFVETLLHEEVTAGCGPSAFCPLAATSREQMAVFVLVAKEGAGNTPPACTTPMFSDVPASSPFCPWIEELARRGVVSGCGGGNYCPTQAVSREQMAVFVLATKEPGFMPPACGTPMFADVPASSPFCPWIEELARRGVVAGCGGGNYCPTLPVTREQMAVFISAGFALQLYGP